MYTIFREYENDPENYKDVNTDLLALIRAVEIYLSDPECSAVRIKDNETGKFIINIEV